MSVFSENMAAVSSNLDHLFGDTASITPRGGSAASVEGRLGPERVVEDDSETRRGRDVSRTFSFDPANGPTARFTDGTATADGYTYFIVGVDSRTASKIVLKLSRSVTTERSGRNYRVN